MRSTFLPTLVNVLSQLPPINVLEALLVEVSVYPHRLGGLGLGDPVFDRKGEMMVFLELLTRRRFPSLKKVTVSIIVSSTDRTLLSSDTRVQQLTERKEELEGMKWDFGPLFIDIRKQHSYV